MNNTQLILVVDADPLLLRATVRLLNQAGYRTCQAGDGLTGLQLARAHKPDLTLLDVNLPDLSGVEVCRRIKADPALTAHFVVLFSGSPIDAQSQVDTLGGGADGYIVRPVTNEELLARVRGMLRIQHAEDRLRESEEQYGRLFEGASLGIFQSTPEGKALSVNPAFAQMFGYASPRDALQSIENVAVDLFVDPNRRAEIMRLLAEQPELRTFENRYRRKDGSSFIGSLSTTPVRNSEGRLVRIEGIIEDITERKRAEEALRQREKKFRILFEQSNDAIFIHDDKGHMLDINPRAVDMLGYSREEMLALPTTDYHPPEVVANAMAAFNELVKTDHVRFDSKFRKKGGSVIDVEISVRQIETGSAIFQALVRDITARKQAEEALRESESKYRLLFENMEEGFALHEIITDENGHPIDFRFLDANAAYERHTGLKPKDCIGKTVREIMPQVDPRQIENYGKVALTGDPLTFEYYSKPFGRHFRVRAFSPQLGRFATIFEDITERKRAEEALRIQHDLNLALGSSANIHQALEQILDAALRMECIDCGGIYLTDPSGALDLVVHRGLAPQFIEQAMHYPADAPQARLAREGETRYDSYQSIRPESNAVRAQENLRALAVIPVVYQGELLAVLNLASHTHDDIPVHIRHALEALVQQIGSTLMRLRFEEALAQQNDALSKLNRFSIGLAMLASEDNLQAFISKQLKEMTGAKVAVFSEYNPEARTTTVQHIEMEPGLLDKAVGLLGKQ
ncbi:MAG TPA: PAS domain S-box protein, partial [Anaerolineae bacterium]